MKTRLVLVFVVLALAVLACSWDPNGVWTPTATPAPTATPPATEAATSTPIPPSCYHIVAEGETLVSIAQKTGWYYPELAKVNHLSKTAIDGVKSGSHLYVCH